MSVAAHHSMIGGNGSMPYAYSVEWLEACGEQFIFTGLPIKNNTGYQVEMEYCFATYPSAQANPEAWVYGYWNSRPSNRLYLIGMYKTDLRCGAGPDNSFYHCNISRDTNFHVAKLLNNGAYFDGVRKCATVLNTLANPPAGMTSVMMFKSPHVDNGGTRRVKYCKIWSIAGELLRDYKGVVDFNDIPCVYDAVENTLTYNAGTGNFGIGPKI